MRSLASTLLTVVLLVGAVGCGGDEGGSAESVPRDAELERTLEEIERAAPRVGLGESSPPPDLTAGWKTDFSRATVPLDEIVSGGPPKDGIPALDEPTFETAVDVDWLRPREPVIALTVEGETRGYPLQVLIWHEIANDEIQGRPVAVTFCPLCNTAIVFDRRVGRRVLDFGTTGRLRDSDLVMYDRQTESWWQQFSGEAIVGKLAGEKLRQLPARIVSWEEFRLTYPESLVLDRETGYQRAYGSNPYVGYDDVEEGPLFPTRNADDDRLTAMTRVVYVERGSEAIVVPLGTVAREKIVRVQVGGEAVVVRWQRGVASALDSAEVAEGREIGSASVTVKGQPVPFHEPFWFAVAAFRPDVRVVSR
jgi:hypothetical protein